MGDIYIQATGGSDIAIEDSGNPVTSAVTKINFAGAGITVTEPVADEVTVTVAPGAAPVDSVHTRTGAVVSQSGDYTAAEVTNVPAGNIAATTAQAAIDELDTEKAPNSHTQVYSTVDGVPTSSLLGRNTAGTGASEALSATAARALLSVEDGSVAAGTSGDAYATSHEADTTAHTAAEVVNTPAGTVAATTVQAAINELDTDKSATGHGHTLSDVSDSGTAAAQDVGTAIGDVAQLENVGGNPGLPAVDGSQLTGVTAAGTMLLEEEGAALPNGPHSTINFIGGGVTAADGGAGTATVTIAPGAAPIDTVFSRTGTVLAAASDYDASQVDNDSTVVGTFVDDALNTLDAALGTHTHDTLANVAQDRLLGRLTAGSGLSEELTAAQARTMLNVADGATASGTMGQGEWVFAGFAITTVSAGQFVSNNSDLSLITQIQIHQTPNSGGVLDTLLSGMGAGDFLYFQLASDPKTAGLLLEVNATPTDAGSSNLLFGDVTSRSSYGSYTGAPHTLQIERVGSRTVGDVTAAATLPVDEIVTGDTAAKGVKTSGIAASTIGANTTAAATADGKAVAAQADATAAKTKTDWLTVTQAVDLDALEIDAAASKVITDFIAVTQAVDLDAMEIDAAASKVITDFIAVTQAVDLDAIETDSAASKVITDFISVTQAVDLDAMETDAAASKVITDWITVTQAVDLDALETNVGLNDTHRGFTAANPHGVSIGNVLAGNVAQFQPKITDGPVITAQANEINTLTADASPASGYKFIAETGAGAKVSIDFDDMPGGGTSDHGLLTGLADDDHTQYHTDARGDARYDLSATVDAKVATALSRSGGQMQGNITMLGAETVDGRDISADWTTTSGHIADGDIHRTIGIGNTAGKTAYATTDYYYHDTQAGTYQRYTGSVWEDVGLAVDDVTLEATTDLHIKGFSGAADLTSPRKNAGALEWVAGGAVHAIAGAQHTPDPLASWQALVSDQDIIGSLDPRLGSAALVLGHWNNLISGSTVTDPGAGNLGTNNQAIKTTVTNLQFNTAPAVGPDADDIFAALAVNDLIVLQNVEDTVDTAIFRVNGTPVDNTGWWNIPVTHRSSVDAVFDNTKRYSFQVVKAVSAASDPLLTLVSDTLTQTITTGWTSWTAVTGCTITPAAGTYFVQYNLHFNSSVASQNIWFQPLLAGAVIGADTESVITTATVATHTAQAVGFFLVTVNGSQAISIQTTRFVGSGNYDVTRYRMSTMRVQ